MEYTEALVLVLSFVILLALRVPIAYSIGLSASFTLLLSMPSLPALTTMAQRMATSLDSFALLAIPFFILAGQVMNRGVSHADLSILLRPLWVLCQGDWLL